MDKKNTIFPNFSEIWTSSSKFKNVIILESLKTLINFKSPKNLNTTLFYLKKTLTMLSKGIVDIISIKNRVLMYLIAIFFQSLISSPVFEFMYAYLKLIKMSMKNMKSITESTYKNILFSKNLGSKETSMGMMIVL